MSQHPDLTNAYLNEQGLKQERDALRAENERLREAWKIVEPHLPASVYQRALVALYSIEIDPPR